jgi:hypothetical protein
MADNNTHTPLNIDKTPSFLKQGLRENLSKFSKIMCNNNILRDIPNLPKLIEEVLTEWYVSDKQDIVDFLDKKPSTILMNNMFLQFGIDQKTVSSLPESLKANILYQLNILFSTKGSKKTYTVFDDIFKSMFSNLNYYNVVVNYDAKIKEYRPNIQSLFYIKEIGEISDMYNIKNNDASLFIDNELELKYFSSYNDVTKKLKVKLKFFEELKYNAKICFFGLPERILERGGEVYEVSYAYNIESDQRSPANIRYELDPILINNKAKQIYELDASDLRTNKYLMIHEDYFDTNYLNSIPKNVFPINTNVLYIQFDASEAFDSMELYPDLIRMYGMTSLQFNKIPFQFDDVTVNMTLSDYVDTLVILKLKEVGFDGDDIFKHVGIIDTYTMSVVDLDKLNEISNCIELYKDMGHSREQFDKFRSSFDKLKTYNSNKTEKLSTLIYKVFNKNEIDDAFLRDSIIKVVYEVFDYDIIEKNNSNTVNKLIKDVTIEIDRIINIYSPTTMKEFIGYLEEHEQKIINLNDATLFNKLEGKLIGKYPRLFQKIMGLKSFDSNKSLELQTKEGYNPEKYVELFILNFQIFTTNIINEHIYIHYFVADLFSRFIQGGSFQREFFDPVMNMFQQYFTKAEQSYQNRASVNDIFKNKLQQIIATSTSSSNTLTKQFSTTEYMEWEDNRVNIEQTDNIISEEKKQIQEIIKITLYKDGVEEKN